MRPDRETGLSIEKDSQINVVVNRQDEGNVIDLMRVFHNFAVMKRVYAWVLILCIVIGICVPLLLYQFSKKSLRVVSVVTLDYDVADPTNPWAAKKPVQDLTAPDGYELDLSQITSAYVLQNALQGLVLSEQISLTQLRDNIKVERILTEDSRRQQEVASKMLEDKNNGAYTQLQSVKLTYINQFVVSLDNGFKDEDDPDSSRKKIYLQDDELRVLLDRVLSSYNAYLAKTYADFRMPADEISVIDTENLDFMESLDLLRSAMTDLYSYCSAQSSEVKEYRSWRDGRSLSDLMETLQTAREVKLNYLYSYVYANSIALDQEVMLSKYRYLLREAQLDLDVVNEKIATSAEMIRSYKHDQIFVENQDSDSAKSTQVTTDYYNKLILEQAQNYDDAASLQITIDDLNEKITNLEISSEEIDTEEVKAELDATVLVCSRIYDSICAQMEEIMATPLYTTFADASAAQGESEGFLSANMKNVIKGAVIGAVLGCGIWFVAAFAAEMKHGRKRPSEEEVTR